MCDNEESCLNCEEFSNKKVGACALCVKATNDCTATRNVCSCVNPELESEVQSLSPLRKILSKYDSDTLPSSSEEDTLPI